MVGILGVVELLLVAPYNAVGYCRARQIDQLRCNALALLPG